MNPQRMSAVLQVYLLEDRQTALDSFHFDRLKWRAVHTFQTAWNPDADDFGGMLREALADLPDLVPGPGGQPVDGLLALADSPQGAPLLRERLATLFSDDAGDLTARDRRIRDFRDSVNGDIGTLFPNSRTLMQSIRSSLALLTLWRPAENFFFDAPATRDWQRYVGFLGTPATGATPDIPEYYRMCREILQDLELYQDVLASGAEKAAKELPGCDDRNHILVYDILRRCYARKAYEQAGLVTPTKTQQELLLQMDALETRISSLDEQLDAVGFPSVLPDLVGAVIHHSRWGDGTVVNVPGPSIWVQFPDRLHKAPRERFLHNPCVSLDFPYVEALDRNRTIDVTRRDLLLKRQRAVQELEPLTRRFVEKLGP